MRKCSADVNHIRLHGAVGEAPVYSHLNHGVEFYTFPLVVRRLSGAEDQVNVVAPLELLECCGPLERESELTVLGEVRTFNNRTGVGSRLVISAFARELREQKEDLAAACREMTEDVGNHIHSFHQMRNLYEK